MKFKYHVFIGLIVSVILTYLFNLSLFEGTVIFLASFLIDADHYFWYAFETKDINPLHAITWYIASVPKWKKLSKKQRLDYKKGVFIFHNWICWTILLILGSIINLFFILILSGFIVHITLDLITLKRSEESLMQKLSLSYILKNNKGKKSLTKL
tara:strand:- start:1 stop:465 length:465 start_codon:yes stop_codon:yes gene_type:complete